MVFEQDSYMITPVLHRKQNWKEEKQKVVISIRILLMYYISLCIMCTFCPNYFLKILFIYFQRKEKGGRKRGGETSMCGFLSCTPPTGDLAGNPGMCPDWELNWRPFGLQTGTQSTESHQSGQIFQGKIRTHIIHGHY